MMRLTGLIICGGVTVAAVVWSTSSAEHPKLLVSAESRPPAISRCAECHSEIVAGFESAPHHNTLTRAEGDVLKRFAGQSHSTDAGGVIRFVERDGGLWTESETTRDSLRIDWIYGSGHHAQTPVSVLTGPDGRLELIEHSVSLYPGSGLGTTLGQSETTRHTGLLAFGNHHGPSAAQECFSCHASHLGNPRTGSQSDPWPHDVVVGVGCIRCHVRAGEHVRTIDDGTLSLDRWSELSPTESINRCGECHRRADHFTADELVPENQTLVRFAPVGLSLSACFLNQSGGPSDEPSVQRLDCLTCHNPHAAMPTDSQVFRKTCLRCHTGAEHGGVACSSQPPDSNCLVCHMPKVPANNQLKFTDHWIRVRRPQTGESGLHP